jgi:hypothetical protein
MPNAECGSWCVYYTSKGISGACKNCSAYVHDNKPKSELNEVDPFELAKLIAQKRESDRRKAIPQLSDCPRCLRRALFYNIIDDSFTCLSVECHKYRIETGTLEYQSIVIKFKIEPQ